MEGKEEGKIWYVPVICLPPPLSAHKKEKRKEREREVGSSPQACLHPPASPPECRHGRFGTVGAGGSPAPQSEAQPPAGLHGSRKEEEGEGGGRREARVRKIVPLPSWAAGKQDWFLARDRGRSMKVGAKLVSRP